jgi:tetratricopeptide (TPR) repeat protein
MRRAVLVLLALAASASAALASAFVSDATLCRDLRATAESRIAYCRSAIKDGNFDMYADLAHLQRIEGKYDDALASLAILTARLPELLDHPSTQSEDWVPVLIERGTIYAEIGRVDDAVKDADALGRIVIIEALHLSVRCMVRAVAGKELEQGLDDCNRALERKPDMSATLEARGLLYFKLGRFQEALADFDAALERNRGLGLTRFARGVVKLRLGDTKGGNEDIEEAEKRDGSVALYLAGCGIAP